MQPKYKTVRVIATEGLDDPSANDSCELDDVIDVEVDFDGDLRIYTADDSTLTYQAGEWTKVEILP